MENHDLTNAMGVTDNDVPTDIPWRLPNGVPTDAITIQRILSRPTTEGEKARWVWRVQRRRRTVVRYINETQAYYDKYIPPF